ncbi:hypothetical protein Pan216_46680 [Planctomycetes bacterium Pan216]|uniref:Uncharacterized protein n=1 Tax=Kolteria novifilia TaxID=2527975 RepID=A0A518BA22_9BACT|nr:hypothetical protein Pan216_46680 [Planctomycetes bacterium Pan216]
MSMSGNTPEYEFGAELTPRVPQRWAGQTQLEFEIEFFGGILDSHPDQLDILRVMASNLAARGEYEQTLELDRRLVRLSPGDPVAYYNLACSFARLDMIAESCEALRRSFEYGYDDLVYLFEDQDLDSVRRDPAFREILETHGLD